MKFLTLIKANIKKQKGSFIGILIMMMIISISISSILSVNINSYSRIDEAIEEVGVGDVVCWIADYALPEPVEDVIEKVEAIKDVEKAENIRCVMLTININGMGNEDGNNNTFCAYNPQEHPYNVYNDSFDGFLDNPETLNDGEIYLPVTYKDKYVCEKGDVLTISDNDDVYEFKIKGFIEDPFIGGSMIGVKQLFITQSDLDMLCEKAEDELSGMIACNLMNIYQSDTSTLTYNEFKREVNEVITFSMVTLGLPESRNYTMLLNQIFSAILIGFAVILLAVTLIVISHSVSTSIEMDYVNLGILKAIGFTKGQLRTVIIFQYIFAVVIGMLIGIPLSIPVIKFMNTTLVSVTGLLASSNVVLLPCITILIAVFLLVIGFIYLKTRKIAKITPMRAISGGRDSVYFSSRLQMSIHKKAMSLWIALRQLTSNMKQYIGVMLISVILVFFLSMISALGGWVTGDSIRMIFSTVESDFSVYLPDDIAESEIEDIINKYTTIEENYQYCTIYLLVDGNNYNTTISSDASQYRNVIYGRTCTYDNEILVTQQVADELGKTIGDKVTVRSTDNSEEFIISGIFQCANDAGMSVGINSDGAEKLGEIYMWNTYKLGDSSFIGNIISDLEDKYGENGEQIKYIDTTSSFNDYFEIIVTAVNALSSLMYIIAVLFVIITVALICGKVIAKEKSDSGILKSLGFTSDKLRLQFALRFLIVSFIGGVIGVIFTSFLKNTIMSLVLRSVGLVQLEISQTLFSVVFPVIFISIMFFVLAYLFARKIRKSDIRCLVAD